MAGKLLKSIFGDISASGHANFGAPRLLSAGAATGGNISAPNYRVRNHDCLDCGGSIDSAITTVNSQRATFGAAVNQLTYANRQLVQCQR